MKGFLNSMLAFHVILYIFQFHKISTIQKKSGRVREREREREINVKNSMRLALVLGACIKTLSPYTCFCVCLFSIFLKNA